MTKSSPTLVIKILSTIAFRSNERQQQSGFFQEQHQHLSALDRPNRGSQSGKEEYYDFIVRERTPYHKLRRQNPLGYGYGR